MQQNLWVKEVEALSSTSPFAFPPSNIQAWLLKPYIISKALKRCCQKLNVQVLNQSFQEPYLDELQRLDFELKSEGLPFIRRVYLRGDGVPWTYGRVIVPPKTYQAHLAKFEGLAQNAIGEKLLYNNPDVERSAFEYIGLSFSQDAGLYQEIVEYLPYPHSFEPIWGRRSVFTIKGDPLIVSEYFLPKIPSYCSEGDVKRREGD